MNNDLPSLPGWEVWGSGRFSIHILPPLSSLSPSKNLVLGSPEPSEGHVNKKRKPFAFTLGSSPLEMEQGLCSFASISLLPASSLPLGRMSSVFGIVIYLLIPFTESIHTIFFFSLILYQKGALHNQLFLPLLPAPGCL